MADDKKGKLAELFLTQYGELSRFVTRKLGHKADAEDVLQDTYIRIQGFSSETEISNPRSFIFRVTDNIARDHARRHRTHEQRFVSEEIGEKADDAPSAERVLDYRQRLEKLKLAISRLPPRQHQVFLMHKFDELSHAEIAAELGITKSAVEKLIMKALGQLRDEIGKLNG